MKPLTTQTDEEYLQNLISGIENLIKRDTTDGKEVLKIALQTHQLNLALIKQDVEKVEKFIESFGVNFIENGFTLLIRAIKNYGTEITKLLLEKGADVNKPDEVSHFKMTPLMWSLIGSNEEIFDLLLEKGADVNYKNQDGQTALSIVSLMISSDNIDDKNKNCLVGMIKKIIKNSVYKKDNGETLEKTLKELKDLNTPLDIETKIILFIINNQDLNEIDGNFHHMNDKDRAKIISQLNEFKQLKSRLITAFLEANQSNTDLDRETNFNDKRLANIAIYHFMNLQGEDIGQDCKIPRFTDEQNEIANKCFKAITEKSYNKKPNTTAYNPTLPVENNSCCTIS